MSNDMISYRIAWFAAKGNDTELSKLFLKMARPLGLMDAIQKHYPSINGETVFEFRKVESGSTYYASLGRYGFEGKNVNWQQFGVVQKSMDRWIVKDTEYRVVVAYAAEINTLFVDERGIIVYE